MPILAQYHPGRRPSTRVAFLARTCSALLVALVGLWVFASWAVAVHENEEYQLAVLLGGALPFIAACVTVQWLLYQYHVQRSPPRHQALRTALLALILGWPMLVLLTICTRSMTLPMLDDRTPTPGTLWVLLVGW